MKTFRVYDFNGSDVFGTALDENNAYIKTYGKVALGYKSIDQLDVDQSTRKIYNLSGQKSTVYIIVRES